MWKRISSQYPNVLSSIVWGIPKELLAYVVAHTFGIRITYPGALKLLQTAYGNSTDYGLLLIVCYVQVFHSVVRLICAYLLSRVRKRN